MTALEFTMTACTLSLILGYVLCLLFEHRHAQKEIDDILEKLDQYLPDTRKEEVDISDDVPPFV